MDWATINPALIALFTAIAVDQEEPEADDAWSAEWKDRRREYIHPVFEQSLYLKVTTVAGMGEANIRYRYDEAENTLYEQACMQRRFTLQLQSVVTENEDALLAIQTLERVATRLQWQTSIDALRAVEVSVLDILPARDVSYTRDKRMLSVAVMDVILAASSVDENPIPIGWIERILLTTQFSREGTLLPSPPNVEDELIPPE